MIINKKSINNINNTSIINITDRLITIIILFHNNIIIKTLIDLKLKPIVAQSGFEPEQPITGQKILSLSCLPISPLS